MTNRELLELAAKAAGLYVQGDESHLGFFSGLNIREDDCPGGYRWNPITDDRDALRLAVDLCLFESFDFHMEVCRAQSEDDPHAATRRAIVRAAAEIGKAKQ